MNSFTVRDLTEDAASFKRIQPSTYYQWVHATKDFQDQSPDQITRQFAIRHRLDLCRREYGDGYIRSRLGYLSAIWKTGIKMEYVTTNPWSGLLEGLKKPRKIYDIKPFDHFKEFHEDPLFMGLWLHGFRVSELACLSPEDFVTDAAIPHIHVRHNTIRKVKNDYTQRVVPIHPSFFRYVDKFPFTSNPNAGDNFSRRLKKSTGISAHGLRHNFITRMRQVGVEYSIAMAIVGHKPQGMTASYGQVLLVDMLKELSKL